MLSVQMGSTGFVTGFEVMTGFFVLTENWCGFIGLAVFLPLLEGFAVGSGAVGKGVGLGVGKGDFVGLKENVGDAVGDTGFEVTGALVLREALEGVFGIIFLLFLDGFAVGSGAVLVGFCDDEGDTEGKRDLEGAYDLLLDLERSLLIPEMLLDFDDLERENIKRLSFEIRGPDGEFRTPTTLLSVLYSYVVKLAEEEIVEEVTVTTALAFSCWVILLLSRAVACLVSNATTVDRKERTETFIIIIFNVGISEALASK